jgi:tRNA pseudouridine55 synthase
MSLNFGSGIFLLNKPAGPTSHDAVYWARQALGTDRVGHCGSLDPAATGLLLLVVRDGLKEQNRFMATRKVYRCVIRLGSATDTDDLKGKLLDKKYPRSPADVPNDEARSALAGFVGEQEQAVPLYSAVKIKGQRLYELARKGQTVELPKKTITIHSIAFLGRPQPEDVEVRVDCSKGTYIRSLARDLGDKLQTGGTLAFLCREAVGAFRVEKAYSWDGNRDVPGVDLRPYFIPLANLDFRTADGPVPR